MFNRLTLKIAIPNITRLNCLAWNNEQGWIGVGGDNGLVKVLKLDTGKDSKVKSLAAPANLSMNQTLEGHNAKVQVITWNEQHQKLTTSDATGLIIVWMLYKGSWYEEMINNRNKSVVKGMAWNSDGQKICIVYEDGAVIVGSVDGNRIWGKELKGSALTGVQWSPNSKLLVFSLASGDVHVYDNQGTFTMKLSIQCPLPGGGIPVMGLAWYDGRHGYVEPSCPCLAIVYQTGQVQIMRAETDEAAVLVETGVAVACSCWNHNGSVLAIAGCLAVEDRDCNVVQFYTPFGEHLRTVKVPGREVSACAWEGSSLRIALAVDSFIYFANIRPSYRWAHFARTVVYAYNHPERSGTQLTFWVTNNNECYSKTVESLLGIAACKDHCVLATRTLGADPPYGLVLCNAIGTPVDSKFMDMEVSWIAMNSTHVFAASRDNFLLWHYMTPKSHSTLGMAGSRHRKERLYHIDDTPSGVAEVIQDLDRSFQPKINTQVTSDPICCLSASDKMLVLGRQSGTIQRYSLPQVALVQRCSLSCRPHSIAINCDSTRASVIDATGVLTLLEFESVTECGGGGGERLERKDVWDMVWASDNPQLLAIMEKTRLYIFRGVDPEEPIISAGYICSFQDLEIKAVLLDEVMEDPEHPTGENISQLEVKSLRDTRQLLEKVGITEATTFIEQNPHPRLWRLLAEAAMRGLDLATAEAAFVRCSDYAGIQMVKRLANVTSDQLKRAQVAAYFNDFNEAERLYLEEDRRDLAIALRERLGDWFRVIQLMKMGTGGGADSQLEKAWNSIGDYFADRNKWESAREYYEKSSNTERLIQCYQLLEDYDALETCAANLPEKHPLLVKIGEIFVAVGMCSKAVNIFIKSGNVQLAVECCVSLNQWHEAVQLSSTFQPEIARMLDKYAAVLLEKGHRLEAVQLYRNANRFLDAASIMFQLAQDEAKKKCKPLRLKQLFVLAALLIEEHTNSKKLGSVASAGAKSIDFDTSVNIDLKLIDNAWKGAEAYHFLMLAQRQLYDGNSEAAVTTGLHLRAYEGVLPAEDIYCLLAIASSTCKAFGICSRAFMKLESLEAVPQRRREEYANIAMEIFTKNAPRDPRGLETECTNCSSLIPVWLGECVSCGLRFPACIASGRPLTQVTSAWACDACKHSASYSEISLRDHCPLCHAPIKL